MSNGPEPLPGQMLTRLETLSGTLDTVAGTIAAVAARGARTRKLTWALACSLVLDIALTVVVTVLSISAIHDASTLYSAQAAAHSAQLATCAIGNQARADQRNLWGYVTALSAKNPGGNPAELRQFQAYINTTFKLVDCSRLYP